MPDVIRAFIAIPLPESVLEQVQQIQKKLKSCKVHMAWVEPHNVHLTLIFLGDIAPGDIDRVTEAMSGAAVGIAPFKLAAGDIGIFPDLRRPRVLWLGLTGDIPKLAAFQKHLEDRLYEVSQGDWKPEGRHFKAHLTIGRIKTKIDPDLLIRAIREVGLIASDSFMADTVYLIQSRLTPSGPMYSRLKHIFIGNV
jgi:2'-5' RNA ligase